MAQADKANPVGRSQLRIAGFLQDNNAGVDSGRRKPSLHDRFDNGDDAEVVEQETLQGCTKGHIEPAVGNDKTESPAFAQEVGTADKEIGVEAGPASESFLQLMRKQPSA